MTEATNQRDFYGFCLKVDQIELYTAFIERYLQDLQNQNDSFDKVIMDQTQEAIKTIDSPELNRSTESVEEPSLERSAARNFISSLSASLPRMPFSPRTSMRKIRFRGSYDGVQAPIAEMSPPSSPLLHASFSKSPRSPGFFANQASHCWIVPLSPALRDFIRGGIPPNYRRQFWLGFTGCHEIISACPGIFDNIISDHEHLVTEHTSQIDKDVERTFSGAIGSFSRDSLRKVLVAYSWKNPNVGYCQGMNFIAAALLVFMTEEESFWMLSHIVEQILPNYFNKSLSGSRVDARILSHYLKKRIPKLFKHFQKINLELSVFCTHWFLCLYVTALPVETAFRIWDWTFYHAPYGAKVIFETALSILKLHEVDFNLNIQLEILNLKRKKLLATQDDTEAALLLNEETSKFFDYNELLSVEIKPLEGNKVNTLRDKFKKEIDQEIRARDATIRNQEISNLTHLEISELETLHEQFLKHPTVNDFGINF
eukprot:TRINITY_DN8143_c0_g1_i7.p1 TRINITY_DN8143_c0_g1~~TRINITY_DN8143_c0_g1_i7.p1  ORF type:complete len:485 (-),score=130.11 TRINITY_DN8143_c0_g1_i7:30-1484(-)